jgi:hypothetical protein
MLDEDLARLYAVTTKNLNKAVKRNPSRFPSDFMFQLRPPDMKVLRFQRGTSSGQSHGGRRYLPFAFTEQGIAMLSSVLRSERAVQVNIAIMRAFLQLRALLTSNEDLRRKISEMEKRYDARFQAVFATLRQMLETPIHSKRQIGFHAKDEIAARSKAQPTLSPVVP